LRPEVRFNICMTTEPHPGAPRAGLNLAWGWLSIGLAIVAISALGALAVVAEKDSADILSTVALALAILSFSAQLIVALAQSYNGSQQIAQADQVNAATRASLAEIRATSNALLSNQREQFSEVLKAALHSAVPAAVKDVEATAGKDDDAEFGGNGPDSTSQELEDRLIARLNEALSRPSVPSPPAVELRRSPTPLYRRIRSYPTEPRGRELLEILEQFTPEEALVFGRWATRLMERNEQGFSRVAMVARGAETGAINNLVEKGLFTRTARSGSSEPGVTRSWLEMTDLGAELASLLLGEGETPAWLAQKGL
jgi:hypothetical protein